MRRTIYAVLFGVLCLVAGGGVSEGAAGGGQAREGVVSYTPPAVRKVALPNGVTVLLAPRPGTEVVSVRVFVRTGAMNEGTLLGSGVSHVLEHLVSGGTTSKRTEAEYREILARIGGRSNAATSGFVTTYFISTGSEHLGDAVAILALGSHRISKHELSAFFRKPDHRQYRKCQDQVLRKFLRGLQIKYRQAPEDDRGPES